MTLLLEPVRLEGHGSAAWRDIPEVVVFDKGPNFIADLMTVEAKDEMLQTGAFPAELAGDSSEYGGRT